MSDESTLLTRLWDLREDLLKKLGNAESDYGTAARAWRYFKTRAAAEATEPYVTRDVFRSVWETAEFRTFDSIRRARYRKTPRYRAKRRQYDRTYRDKINADSDKRSAAKLKKKTYDAARYLRRSTYGQETKRRVEGSAQGEAPSEADAP